MKRMLGALLALSLFALPAQATAAEPNTPTTSPTQATTPGAPEVEGRSALLMEKETGSILYELNSHDRLEPASVTKIMTLLLTMEAIDAGALALDETVQVSARAASMGGSQVYLKEGETMTVHDLLKAVAVASGNDAAVALA